MKYQTHTRWIGGGAKVNLRVKSAPLYCALKVVRLQDSLAHKLSRYLSQSVDISQSISADILLAINTRKTNNIQAIRTVAL